MNRRFFLRHILLLVVFPVLQFPAIAAAQADQYPNAPIRLIVPVGAGGATDALARTFAAGLAETMGQSVVVENRPGAASIVGAEAAAKAKPDGYTLLFGHVGIFSLNPFLYAKLPYDPQKDFIPVSGVAETPYVLVVAPALPVKTVDELVDYTRARQGQLNYGSVGVGSVQQLAAEWFKSEAELNITGVQYNSPGTLKIDLAENRVQLIFDNVVAAMPMINQGKIRPLAVTSSSRSSMLPDTPTMADSGFPDYRVTSWFGLFAIAGTEQTIVDKLAEATAKVMIQPELQQKLEQLGAQPMIVSTADYANFIADDTRKWADLIRSVGIKPQ